MKFFQQYGMAVEQLLFVCIPALLSLGAVLAFKSNKNKTSLILLLSSSLWFIASSADAYFHYKMYGISGTYTYSPVTHSSFERLMKYSGVCYKIASCLSVIFAFTFIAFCCRVANIFKRNEELEFLTSEMAKRDSEK